MRRRPTCLCAVALSFLSAPTSGASFQGLGDLPGGEPHSWATAVSGDGRVVVGGAGSTASDAGPDDDDDGQAYRWTRATGMVPLGMLPDAFTSRPVDVSTDGSIIVGYSNWPFNWTASEGMVRGPGTDHLVLPDAMSADGSVIVGEFDDGSAPGDHAFRWTAAGGFQNLGHLGSTIPFFTYAQGVSADGSIVVGHSTSSVPGEGGRAFRWAEGTGMVALPLPPGRTFSEAEGISANGRVVVGSVGFPSPSAAHSPRQSDGRRTKASLSLEI
jgi:probable HAF family extracellular repeat protein